MNDRTNALLADAHNTGREQLAAAWQLQIERIQEAIAANWPERIAQIFEERIADLAAHLDEHYENALAETRACVERELSEKLNQSARRLRAFEDEAQWSNALVEATQGFCDRAALFLLEGQSLRFQAARGTDGPAPADNIALASTPAFSTAVESKDTVIAMRTRGELSEPIAAWLGEAVSQKFYVFPVASAERMVALLYADADDRRLESNALELLAAIAGAVWQHPALSQEQQELVNIANAAPAPPVSAWFSLSRDEQDLHLRAQRFARVRIAEMRLYKSQNVKNGRAGRNLYTSLKQEIDSGREAFRRDYLSASPSMVDYFHLELVRTLANDEPELLGTEYPGPMV